VNEFSEIATGQREQLSPECRKISCLPPVIVGLFLGSWDMAERAIAKQFGISTNAVREAWTSLRDQMIRVGKKSIADGLLTEDYILSVPPGLVIGLPARVLLDTIERSPEGELLLASGLRISEDKRPRGEFTDAVWQSLESAKRALAAAQLTPEHKMLLGGALLAGGADPEELPPGLAKVASDFNGMSDSVLKECIVVRNCLTSVAVECSREHTFREELEKVIKSLGDEPDSDAAYNLLSGTLNPPSASIIEDGLGME